MSVSERFVAAEPNTHANPFGKFTVLKMSEWVEWYYVTRAKEPSSYPASYGFFNSREKAECEAKRLTEACDNLSTVLEVVTYLMLPKASPKRPFWSKVMLYFRRRFGSRSY